MRETVDLDAYISARVKVLNASTGSRGYDAGVRIFDCPFCDEARGRGWVNVERWTAGCWNSGCQAEPRIPGGALEWVKGMEGFAGRGQTWHYLLTNFKASYRFKDVRVQPPSTEDFCTLPSDYRDVASLDVHSIRGSTVARFLWGQWSLSIDDAATWQLGVCYLGRYAGRVIIPIVENGERIAFQARSYRGADPKYLNSHSGVYGEPGAECGRRAGELLFNVDETPRGGDVLLVEGAGDVMAWHKGDKLREPHAIGLLGIALTPEKAAILRDLGPGKVIVALDNEPAARRRAFTHIEDLQAWGIPGMLGEWQGAKDAGAGAVLRVSDGTSLKARISSQLGG